MTIGLRIDRLLVRRPFSPRFARCSLPVDQPFVSFHASIAIEVGRQTRRHRRSKDSAAIQRFNEIYLDLFKGGTWIGGENRFEEVLLSVLSAVAREDAGWRAKNR